MSCIYVIFCWINCFFVGYYFELDDHKVRWNGSYLQIMILYGHKEGKKGPENRNGLFKMFMFET